VSTIPPNVIDNLHNEIVSVLSTGGKLFVPTRQKTFYKFWWDEELNALKDASIESNKLWKEADKPGRSHL